MFVSNIIMDVGRIQFLNGVIGFRSIIIVVD